MRPTVLKRSRAREVRVEAGGGDARVVKRFASPGPLDRLLDRRRAERELELLGLLHAAGVPVPRPLGLERRGRGFEVACEHLAGARALDERLAAGEAPPEEAFRALGAALARLGELAIDHPDLHPGNVLVDARGGIALIDFHAARRARAPSAARLARDVVALEAALRERAPLAARRALLQAWLADAGALARGAPRGAELDRAARARRGEVVAGRRRRWRPGGNAVAEAGHPPGRALVRRGAPPGALDALADRPAAPARGAARFAVRRGVARGVEAAWLAAARMDEHALRVARPAAWLRARPSAAAFELEGEARSLADAPLAQRRLALGDLLGSLCDRGLWIPALGEHELLLDAHGRAVVVAPRALEPWPAGRGWLARSGLALRRGEIAEAFLAADRGHDRVRAERELARA